LITPLSCVLRESIIRDSLGVLYLESETRNPYRWYDSVFLSIIPPLSALMIKLLMITCRVVKVEGVDKENKALSQSGGKALYAAWHQRMSYHSHYFGSRHLTIMISRSRDGEYAARVAEWLGYKNVRGSSTRGGLGAFKELAKRMKNGEVGGMLADGPQGPARVAKMGSILLARNAEVPLIPVAWGADRCWMFNSWDRYMVPKPFARIAVFYGEAIGIPTGAKGEELEKYRQILQERLNEGARWCDEQFGVERPWRKVTEEGMSERGPLI
jgi:lysophospholipid acyltransferase (LPLAT)-like uncharacterized protein